MWTSLKSSQDIELYHDFIAIHFKDYFCHNIAFKVQWMKFLTEEKNCISFSRYLDFSVFHESTNFKIYDIIIDITAY